MEGDLRGLSPSPSPGQTMDRGAILQGASLLLLLCVFAVGAFVALPRTDAESRTGPQLSLPDDELGPTPAVIPGHTDVHLVIIVDGDAPGSAAEFLRESDAGMAWVVSVEVISASDVSLDGLQEALTVGAATCSVAGCPELKVLDLRVRDPGGR